MNTISYIINPAGHGGAGIKVWEKVKAEFSDPIDSKNVYLTKRQGHAREIARADENSDILAAVGGDGTVGEVLSGIMDRPDPRPKMAIIPAGTGNDIGRNLGIFSFEDAMDTLRGGYSRRLDLIRIECQLDGREAHRYSFLVGTAGFSAQPMVKPWMKRLLGPTGAYYLGTILQCISYRPPVMTIRWGEEELCERTWMVIAGNIERTSGGSMCLAPGARPDDGVMHVSVIPVRTKLNMLTKMMPQIASGVHVKEPDVRYFPATEIEVTCDPPAILDIDGDLFGNTPAKFTICPQAAEIICPKNADPGVA